MHARRLSHRPVLPAQSGRGGVAALQAAVATRNFVQAETIGHRITRLAGSYGCHQIGAIGGAIEEAALARGLDQITRHIAELDDAVRAAEEPEVNGPGCTGHAA